MDTSYFASRFGLDGRKAIVTGSSGGIGRAIAESLARFGAEVAILGRSPEKLAATEASIRSFGGKCRVYAFEISDPAANERFFEQYEAECGTPDIFVANAGTVVIKYMLETEPEEIDRLIDVDLKGAIYGARWAGNLMKRQGSGNIVFVTSVNALFPLPSQAYYSAVKAAEDTVMKCMAADLGPYGVRVNSLAPGAVNTDLAGPNRAKRPTDGSDLPLRHRAEPVDMGDVVACMVSDAFNYMTGSTVVVDGGLMLRPSKYGL